MYMHVHVYEYACIYKTCSFGGISISHSGRDHIYKAAPCSIRENIQHHITHYTIIFIPCVDFVKRPCTLVSESWSSDLPVEL